MRRMRWAALAVAAALGPCGCSTGPLMENPVFVRPDKAPPVENPLYVPQGPLSYAKVYETVLDVLDDIWEIGFTNRYEGRIETIPKIAPGLEQPWKPGSPDFYQRLYAMLQTVQMRAIVLITIADDGGYFIDLKVFKELEDLPVPIRSTAGMATFQNPTTVERQFAIIEPPLYVPNWIPIGRDLKLEQVLLERIAHYNFSDVKVATPKEQEP
jgi:hypothetical protein